MRRIKPKGNSTSMHWPRIVHAQAMLVGVITIIYRLKIYLFMFYSHFIFGWKQQQHRWCEHKRHRCIIVSEHCYTHTRMAEQQRRQQRCTLYGGRNDIHRVFSAIRLHHNEISTRAVCVRFWYVAFVDDMRSLEPEQSWIEKCGHRARFTYLYCYCSAAIWNDKRQSRQLSQNLAESVYRLKINNLIENRRSSIIQFSSSSSSSLVVCEA